jgi:predicted AAA+ superfamily ATPase
MAILDGPGSEAATGGSALAAGRSLVLYRDVLADEVGRLMLGWLASPGGWAGRRLFGRLAEEAEFRTGAAVGDAWQDHLLDRILWSENAFTRKAESTGWSGLGTALRHAAREDLARLRLLFDAPRPDGLEGFRPLPGPPPPEIKLRLAAAADWGAMAAELAAHHARAGTGLFARHLAFRWSGERFVAVPYPDPVRLSDLFGYEAERSTVVRNTQRFVSGLPANDLLLYGDRGTGKSSTVKALLGAFGDRGLRLCEVGRRHLGDFPLVVEALRGRRQRFVVFVDDLSFEEGETEYKEVKAALEGGLTARPDNVLVYATSNRRHVVRERFSDREGAIAADDPRGRDAAEEKLSLADRFGVTVIFPSPDQELYLGMVAALAARRGLRLDAAELRQRALRWALSFNGRSGRTARQFVDHLQGDLLEEAAAAGSDGAPGSAAPAAAPPTISPSVLPTDLPADDATS